MSERRATTHYLNADFDLSLRPRSTTNEASSLARQSRELTTQALVGSEDGDAVLLRVDVPESFIEYLRQNGLEPARQWTEAQLATAPPLRPFGWSAEALRLNQRCSIPAEHPPLDVVREVNGRRFAAQLEAELEPPGGAIGVVIDSRHELEAWLATHESASGWIIKSEHGHGGLANRRLRDVGLSLVDRRFVDRLFAEDDRLVCEPWHSRLRDHCAVFEVPFSSPSLRVHETICTRDGALIGALFEPSRRRRVDSRIATAVERIATRLEQVGYFGPACCDAYEWSDGQQTRLRLLADLNCRLSMSSYAWRVWQRLASDRTSYYRFFSARQISLPDDAADFERALGSLAFDQQARHGVLLLSPPTVIDAGQQRRPLKAAVLFVAQDRYATLDLERRFRAHFGTEQ